MLYRIKQFFKGLLAFDIDYTLVDSYLSTREKELFFMLPRHERKHAVDAANSIMSFKIKKDAEILIKAALLHDIGKIEGCIGLIKKSILVLMDKFTPSLSNKLSRKVNMFKIYYNHPKIGAEILKKINTREEVIFLVRYHHSEEYDDIDNISILKKADNLN